MTNESNATGDSAQLYVPHQHALGIMHGHIAALSRPADLFGHTTEELLDLAATRHHGGDSIVHPQALQEALTACRNAWRLRVWDGDGHLKHLTFGANCRSNAGGFAFMFGMTGDLAATYLASRTSTGVTATTLTDTGASFPASTAQQHGTGLVGHIVRTGTTYGVILSNTGTVLTIDQWYSVGSTVGAVAATPGTGTYEIMPGQAPVRWIGISTDTATEDIGNTSLPSELVTGFATVPRWFGASTVTTAPSGTGTANSTATLKLDSGVQTANATNTIAKLAAFQTQNGGEPVYIKKLAASATVVSGDTLDASEAVSYA